MGEVEAAIQEAVGRHIVAVFAARERACEAALQSGGYGVLETRHENGDVSFALSAAVPYGHIYITEAHTASPRGPERTA